MLMAQIQQNLIVKLIFFLFIWGILPPKQGLKVLRRQLTSLMNLSSKIFFGFKTIRKAFSAYDVSWFQKMLF